jgi:predicted RNA-binding Zn-ribbon protein involved in translation (DUF1610 family)
MWPGGYVMLRESATEGYAPTVSTPPEEVVVECPKCGSRYIDWYRPSMNLAVETFDPEYIAEASSSVCPSCGNRAEMDVLVVDD